MKLPTKQYVILGRGYFWGWTEIHRTWTYNGALRFIRKRLGDNKYASEHKIQRNEKTISWFKWGYSYK